MSIIISLCTDIDVTSDPAYFGPLNLMSISHHLNLLLMNLGMK